MMVEEADVATQRRKRVSRLRKNASQEPETRENKSIAGPEIYNKSN